jgi:hypothetical protein
MGNLNSTIQHILLESNDPDVSGKYSLFALYSNNDAVLHLFEDKEAYEAMKYKFTSDDKIKRLGASRLPENTTFKKLSESIQDRFNVPRERFSVRTHERVQEERVEQPRHKNVSAKPSNPKPKNSMVEQVLRGKETFRNQPTQTRPEPVQERQEPTINSFRPAISKKIDLSALNNGDKPMLG